MTGPLPVIWLTGNSGAGKSTLARGLKEYYDTCDVKHPLYRRVLILDGDEMRASISLQETLSAEDRRRHNLRVARLATVLQQQGFLVVVAVIAPFTTVRSEIDTICKPVWLYLQRDGLTTADRPYEIPEHPSLTLDINTLDIPDTRQRASAFIEGVLMRQALTQGAATAATIR